MNHSGNLWYRVVVFMLMTLLLWNQDAPASVLVDFGATAGANVFGLAGWTTVLKDLTPTTSYSSVGPDGLLLETTGSEYSNYQGVQGISRSFGYGERILVTWYNNSGNWLSDFTPLVSFTDANSPVNSPGQPRWYGMKNLATYHAGINEFAPGATVRTYYDFTNSSTAPTDLPPSAGNYTIVNVCMNTTQAGLLIDKIELAAADITAPTMPANLSTAAHPTQPDNKINLTWNASTDGTAVTHYRIYRNGLFVNTSSTTSYTDALLTPSTSYTYRVTAFDGFGNESGQSNAATRSTASYRGKSSVINPFAGFQYLGAFKLPPNTGHPFTLVSNPWTYREGDLAYYPSGDPGNTDAYPGSLYLSGFVQQESYGYVAEIGIPVPVISATKNPNELNTATTLRNFTDVKPANIHYPPAYPDEPYLAMGAALEYLPAQSGQTSGKLYTAFGDYYYPDQKKVTNGACDLNLTNPVGAWSVGPVAGNNPPFNTLARYMFAAPQSWADAYTGGRPLLTGNSRYGNWPHGPALYAIAPWMDGTPWPAAGAALNYITLLRYDNDGGTHYVDGFIQDDGSRYRGAEWLSAGSQAAVMISTSKAFGETWYGYRDGTRYYDDILPLVPEFEPAYGVYGEKGPIANSHDGLFLFYDPADLAAVAQGSQQPYGPQPYAALDVSHVLFKPITEDAFEELCNVVGEVAFDETHGLLYMAENRAYGDGIEYENPVIHVWQVSAAASNSYLLWTK
ncbi:fibronectin type III domain protein [Candidatus Vecturithrix granuli]|uniref:Fibronectin type III domain protein n=1 Tax=Vecturithrix granuli TaxID=1499967 RepID=A0A081C246_VECG1|nr:fibronectin type III domain protein [Candidatus Vecturithrix granuli]